MKKNRILILCLVLCLSAGLLSGCGNSSKSGASSDKLSVVCTIYPQYDWIQQIVGNLENNYKFTLLLDNGVDLHSYQPTAVDIATIADCDVFIYAGGESDAWVEDALKEAKNPDMKVINLIEVLGDSVKEEELKEGMEVEEEESGEESSEEEPEYDEHVWLSLKNAITIGEKINTVLQQLDASNKQAYEDNWNNYKQQLQQLDASYEETVQLAKRKTILFGDRFPFRYLTDDYGLTYYAAFVGCSAETEASFKTIAFLSEKVDEENLPVVLTIENSDQKIAKAIIDNSKLKNQKILTMNSIQSITEEEIAKGECYLSAMEENLKVLKEALN